MTIFVAKSTKRYVEFVKNGRILIFVGSKPTHLYEKSSSICGPRCISGIMQPVYLPNLQQERG